MLVVGLGRRLRRSTAQSERARLGAGAVEALQRRYDVRTFFDADVRAYVGTCKSSLDKSGTAGMQTINFLQPLVDHDVDVGAAIYSTLQKPKMDRAMVLFAFSDQRLPFGQLRIRTAFDGDNALMRAAFSALGPEHRVTCLHIGAGKASASDALLAAEVGALPRVLSNAATAIEVWLSEADLGLVMRFVNRPEVYEMPPGWPYNQALPAADGADAGTTSVANPSLQSSNLGALVSPAQGDAFTLFDLNRCEPTELPENVQLAPLSPNAALAALQERPQCEALLVAGRRFESFAGLQTDLVQMMLEHKLGVHLRFADDEEAIKSLVRFHPDSDRLLEDLVAVKVDCSPIDDNTKCLWLIKFDGFEEDISLKACFDGLKNWLKLEEEPQQVAGFLPSQRRLRIDRWTTGLRETIFDRSAVQESYVREANQ